MIIVIIFKFLIQKKLAYIKGKKEATIVTGGFICLVQFIKSLAKYNKIINIYQTNVRLHTENKRKTTDCYKWVHYWFKYYEILFYTI